MIQFNDVGEAVNAAGKYLLKHGTALPTKEWQGRPLSDKEKMRVVLNYSLICNTPEAPSSLAYQCEPDAPWAEDHFQERVSGKPVNPGETYKKWPYNKFKSVGDDFMDGKLFTHTYMERYWPNYAGREGIEDYKRPPLKGIRYNYGNLGAVVEQLNDNPTTRQAYLPIWFPEDTGVVHGGRVPCSLGYLFMPVGDFLHCNYYIRSCDLYRHFRNDVYMTMRLLQWLVGETVDKWKPGILTMHIANFHYFENDLYHIKKDNRWKIE